MIRVFLCWQTEAPHDGTDRAPRNETGFAGEQAMALFAGHRAPDFTARTTIGRIRFHEWLGQSWGMLVTHPGDFHPMTFPHGHLDRSVKILFLPHHAGAGGGVCAVPVPPPGGVAVCDTGDGAAIARLYSGAEFEDTPAPGMVAEHVVFLIAPDRTIRTTVSHPPAQPRAGSRDFREVLHLLDTLRAVAGPGAAPSAPPRRAAA